MKVLFLDIDGVLNSVSWYHRRTSKHDRVHDELDPEALQRLAAVLAATGARVVVSSTWRKIRTLTVIRAAMVRLGLPQELSSRFIDVTPVLTGFRGDEVQDWLSRHPDVEKYAIVDDDSDFRDYQKPFFVNTDSAVGLQDEQVTQLIEILK